MRIEQWYDDHTLFVGDVIIERDADAPGFGLEENASLELQNFHVVVYAKKTFDFDITDSIPENVLNLFMDDFEMYARSRYFPQLVGELRDWVETQFGNGRPSDLEKEQRGRDGEVIREINGERDL